MEIVEIIKVYAIRKGEIIQSRKFIKIHNAINYCKGKAREADEFIFNREIIQVPDVKCRFWDQPAGRIKALYFRNEKLSEKN